MSANRLSFLCAWVFLSGHLQDDKTWGKRKQRGSRKISALMTSVRTRASSYIFRTNEMSLYSPCTPANWMVSTLFSSLSLLPIHLLKTDHLNTKELLLSRWLTLSLGWRNYLRLSLSISTIQVNDDGDHLRLKRKSQTVQPQSVSQWCICTTAIKHHTFVALCVGLLILITIAQPWPVFNKKEI